MRPEGLPRRTRSRAVDHFSADMVDAALDVADDHRLGAGDVALCELEEQLVIIDHGLTAKLRASM